MCYSEDEDDDEDDESLLVTGTEVGAGKHEKNQNVFFIAISV